MLKTKEKRTKEKIAKDKNKKNKRQIKSTKDLTKDKTPMRKNT